MARGRQIGRIKFQPIEPEHQQKYYLDWDAKDLRARPESFPNLTSRELFGKAKPLEVEIGAGSGEYLCQIASAQPETTFLGIEVSRRAAQLAVALAAQVGLENVRILRADFRLLFPLLQPESWQRVYLHFPDPMHKRSDEKRNLFDQKFLDAMASVLIPGGEISVVSDKVDFFFQMLELAEGDGRFVKAHSEVYLEGFEPAIKSRFQLFSERRGIRPRQFVLCKLAPVRLKSKAARVRAA